MMDDRQQLDPKRNRHALSVVLKGTVGSEIW